MSYPVIKRCFDIVGATSGIVFLSPLLLGTAIVIRAVDGPPVLFKQERCGQSGTTFTIYKFRSMSTGAPCAVSAASGTVAGYITRVGAMLRRTNVDELPQLFNVLRGDMSLVGPRPSLPIQHDVLSARSEAARALRPGLTGLAQVRSFDGMSSQQKAELDNQYARGIGLRQDLRILSSTFAYLLKAPPTY